MTDRIIRFAVHAAFYPALWVNRLMCGLGLWEQANWVDEHVAFGSLPTAADMGRLAAEGVGAVVNMCEEYAGDAATMASLGIEQLHLPTLDYHCPDEAALLRGVDFMQAQVRSGRRVLVHCKAGRGRSAIMVLCYLMATRRIGRVDALGILKAARPRLARGIERHETVRRLEHRFLSGSRLES